MAKKQKKNANYQTEAKRAAEREEAVRRQKEEKSRKKRPHNPNESEKQKIKAKTVRLLCVLMVAVLVLTSGTAAVYSLISSKSTSSRSAADYIYPPLFVYEGTVYAVTSDMTYSQPEGDSVEDLTFTTTGDQNSFPLTEGSCNFGNGTVPFVKIDGTIYCKTSEDIYLKCAPFTAASDTSSASPEADSSESE